MLIAKQKKEENIAEYLIYMWQIEDLIRAHNLNIDSIQISIIDQFEASEEVKTQIHEWYQNLIEMMRLEDIVERGHLQINRNVVSNLSDLHLRLLDSPKEMEYSESYYKTLSFIVELRTKTKDKEISELETCFSALYGYLLLRLQRKEVSGETQAAIAQISSLLRQLSIKYKLEQEGKLDI